jgi:hypothetical protein
MLNPICNAKNYLTIVCRMDLKRGRMDQSRPTGRLLDFGRLGVAFFKHWEKQEEKMELSYWGTGINSPWDDWLFSWSRIRYQHNSNGFIHSTNNCQFPVVCQVSTLGMICTYLWLPSFNCCNANLSVREHYSLLYLWCLVDCNISFSVLCVFINVY